MTIGMTKIMHGRAVVVAGCFGAVNPAMPAKPSDNGDPVRRSNLK